MLRHNIKYIIHRRKSNRNTNFHVNWMVPDIGKLRTAGKTVRYVRLVIHPTAKKIKVVYRYHLLRVVGRQLESNLTPGSLHVSV